MPVRFRPSMVVVVGRGGLYCARTKPMVAYEVRKAWQLHLFLLALSTGSSFLVLIMASSWNMSVVFRRPFEGGSWVTDAWMTIDGCGAFFFWFLWSPSLFFFLNFSNASLINSEFMSTIKIIHQIRFVCVSYPRKCLSLRVAIAALPSSSTPYPTPSPLPTFIFILDFFAISFSLFRAWRSSLGL